MPEKWPHVMLDLETMGNGPDAAIVAIGAVAFDVEHGLGPEFYTAVDLGSSMSLGGTVTAGTVMWWLRQGDDARDALGASPQHITTALFMFSEWMLSLNDWGGEKPAAEKITVWGNGAAFDNVILASAYDRAGVVSKPWVYRNDRCYRTLRSLAPDIKRPTILGTPHNALDDAKFQAVHAIEILRALSLPEKR